MLDADRGRAHFTQSDANGASLPGLAGPDRSAGYFQERRVPADPTPVSRSLCLPRRVSGLLVLLLALAWAGVAAATPVATPTTVDAFAFASVKPDQQSAIAAATANRFPAYRIDVTLDPSNAAAPRLGGTEHLHFVNNTGQPLSELPFRLYANNPGADAGSMKIVAAAVAGRPVQPELSVSDTVAVLPLSETLPPGGAIGIDLSYTATVPIDSRGDYGIYSVDQQHGTWALSFWYPVIAGWDPDHGFELDPVSRNGDAIFSSTAFFDVTVRAPASWRLATTGVEMSRQVAGDTQITRFSAGPVRDFNLVADNDFGNTTVEVDGTRIVAWFDPGRERVATAAANDAALALRLYNQLFGPYPYVELDIVPVELYGASGVEFPQLIYIDSNYYSPDQQVDVPNAFTFTVAHEVMHQWWYGLVGNNQYLHAFMDEGLTNYISCQVFFDKEYGPVVAAKMSGTYLVTPYQAMLKRNADQVVDTPTDAFHTEGAYVSTIYSKAPLGFQAINQAIGDDAFFAALRQYAATERFQVAQPDDLKRAFEHASGKNLDALWEQWFESAKHA